jgi:hypothetical protein
LNWILKTNSSFTIMASGYLGAGKKSKPHYRLIFAQHRQPEIAKLYGDRWMHLKTATSGSA